MRSAARIRARDRRPSSSRTVAAVLTGTGALAAVVLRQARAATTLTGSSALSGTAGTTLSSLTLPLRGAFYYPWFSGGSASFPGAWTQGFAPWTQYHPLRGYYNSTTTSIIDAHIGDLTYAKFDFGISSWWGQASKENTNFPALLDRAQAAGGFRWCLYYEGEGNVISGVTGSPNPTSAQITADLNYITAHYTSHPNYLRVGGKPVIFAYGDPTDEPATTTDVTQRAAARWYTAAAAATEQFFYVLKVYGSYTTDNATYPAPGWHQYGPASNYDQQGTYSATVSPGFWLATETTPRLARDPARFATDVTTMLAASVDWKLVTSFNEFGEGHPVEPVDSGSGRDYVGSGWTSSTGHGSYLDILARDGQAVAATMTGSGTLTAAGSSGAAVAEAQHATTTITTAATGGSITVPATTTGNLLCAWIGRSGGLTSGAVSSVTDSAGQTWTVATRGATSGLTNTRLELWYRANSASVTSVTFTSSASQTGTMTVQEFTHIAATSPVDVASPDNSAAASSSTTPSSPAVTTTVADLVVAGARFGNTTVTDPGSPWASVDVADSAGTTVTAWRSAATAGSYSATWTLAAARTPGVITVGFKTQ